MKHGRLVDTSRFPGFPPTSSIQGAFGAPKVWILPLHRWRENGLQQLRPCPSGVLCLQDRWVLDLNHKVRGLQRHAFGLRDEEVSPLENSHLHAPQRSKMPKSYPHDYAKSLIIYFIPEEWRRILTIDR